MRKLQETTHFIRQGDVLFKRIQEIDKTAVPIVDSKTVALGEATGHHHTFNGQVLLFSKPEDSEIRYVQVLESSASLVHQEHEAIQVPEGKYEVIKEQEYNPFTRQITRTRD